jgi:hypothetical protein
MTNHWRTAPPTSAALDLAPPVRAGLALLLAADRAAAERQLPAWEFAVGLPSLLELGLTATDVRVLICDGHVAHRIETSGGEEQRRTFQPVASLTLNERSCLVLTDQGRQAARALGPPAGAPPAPNAHSGPAHNLAAAVPYWDQDRGRLTFLGLLVKQFQQQARNQRAVLSAFQEEHWVSRIDSPIPSCGPLLDRKRFHDTLTGLNKYQVHHLLRFRADGSGEGILWERI